MQIDLFPYSSTLLCLAALSAPQAPPVDQPLYTVKERNEIVSYWNKPGRYQTADAPPAPGDGPWQVRLTADGSKWFHNYQKAVAGPGKTAPTTDVRAAGAQSDWEAWVTNKLAYDRWQAGQQALAANRSNGLAPDIRPVANTSDTVRLAPPAPGPMPESLRAVCGDAPIFAEAAAARLYRVTFDKKDDTFTYTDHVRLRDRYAYYRFPQGVVCYGKRVSEMAPRDCESLFRDAGFSPADQRIFSAVSRLEGGFETVQTYDTGFVSIGFIQFVTLEDGKADLSNVLLEEKTDAPKEFQQDFHRFGIDVRPDHTLVVVDPASGAELVGANAVMRIIDDKRLTAVFQRAGRRKPFQIAQIKIAKSYYWPTADPLTVTLPDGTVVSGTIGDVVKSEAGLATLLDRKINTGNLKSVPGVVTSVMAAHGCRTFADALRYEREIIASLVYRENFLADNVLAQPLPPEAFPVPTPTPTPTP